MPPKRSTDIEFMADKAPEFRALVDRLDAMVRDQHTSIGHQIAEGVNSVLRECPFLRGFFQVAGWCFRYALWHRMQHYMAIASLNDHMREEFRCAVDRVDGAEYLWVWDGARKMWCPRRWRQTLEMDADRGAGRPRTTADPRGPPRTTVGRRGPPWAAVGHRGPPWTTADHRGPPRATVGHRGPPRTPADPRGPPRTTADHRGPPWAAVGRRGPPWTTADHRGPPWATVDPRGPPRTPADHRGPPRTTADHRGPPRTTADHR
eukprot:gene10341-1245_t